MNNKATTEIKKLIESQLGIQDSHDQRELEAIMEGRTNIITDELIKELSISGKGKVKTHSITYLVTQHDKLREQAKTLILKELRAINNRNQVKGTAKTKEQTITSLVSGILSAQAKIEFAENKLDKGAIFVKIHEDGVKDMANRLAMLMNELSDNDKLKIWMMTELKHVITFVGNTYKLVYAQQQPEGNNDKI